MGCVRGVRGVWGVRVCMSVGRWVRRRGVVIRRTKARCELK